MANKKEFSEFTRSRLNDLYKSTDDVINEKPEISLFGKTVTFEDLQNIMGNQPFIETKIKSESVDLNSITSQDVAAIDNALDHVPKGQESAIMEITQIVDNPNVRFFHAEIKNRGGSAKLLSPRMIINVGDVAPNSGIRINTGYALKMPKVAKGQEIKSKEIVENANPTKQPDYVIIPRIIVEGGDAVPAIYARDQEDTGLFTVNLTTVSGKIGKIQVIFRAYKADRKINRVTVINPEHGASSKLFKPKDTESGRFVKNPRIKIHFDTFKVDENGTSSLSTFNSTTKPKTTFVNQKVQIDKLTTVFTSRKREWCDPNLLTLSGIYTSSSTNPNCALAPKVAKGSEYDKNTHCLVFIESKLTLFSVQKYGKCASLKIINGAFANIENYDEITKSVRQIIAGSRCLSVGAKKSTALAKKYGSTVDKVLTLFDHHRSFPENDRDILEKLENDENGMFNCKPLHTNAYSVNMYKGFKYLLFAYCKDKFTEEQLNELKLNSINSIKNEKRSSPENHAEEEASKKLLKIG